MQYGVAPKKRSSPHRDSVGRDLAACRLACGLGARMREIFACFAICRLDAALFQTREVLPLHALLWLLAGWTLGPTDCCCHSRVYINPDRFITIDHQGLVCFLQSVLPTDQVLHVRKSNNNDVASKYYY